MRILRGRIGGFGGEPRREGDGVGARGRRASAARSAWPAEPALEPVEKVVTALVGQARPTPAKRGVDDRADLRQTSGCPQRTLSAAEAGVRNMGRPARSVEVECGLDRLGEGCFLFCEQ